MSLEKISKVSLNMSKGRPYFKTSIPHDVGRDVLGLTLDTKDQKIAWRICNGEITIKKVVD